MSAAIHRGYAPGDVFVAIPGFREDGRCHIAEAKARGAVCVLSREPVQELPWAAVQDPRRALAEVSARLYRHPDRELAVVGVTAPTAKPPPPVWCATSSDRRWGCGWA